MLRPATSTALIQIDDVVYLRLRLCSHEAGEPNE